jgi:hypothetical protein
MVVDSMEDGVIVLDRNAGSSTQRRDERYGTPGLAGRSMRRPVEGAVDSPFRRASGIVKVEPGPRYFEVKVSRSATRTTLSDWLVIIGDSNRRRSGPSVMRSSGACRSSGAKA